MSAEQILSLAIVLGGALVSVALAFRKQGETAVWVFIGAALIAVWLVTQ